MDLQINLDKVILYVRVAVMVKSNGGYIFEQHKNGYYFPVGGKIMAKEQSLDAAKREIAEELGLEVDKLNFIGLLENFYEVSGVSTHEICFIYKTEEEYFINIDNLETGDFIIVNKDNYKNLDIKPTCFYDLIENDENIFTHIVLGK
jgi:8-oxo-dGTP pyrophosphatase MutT (NUDIX family)